MKKKLEMLVDLSEVNLPFKMSAIFRSSDGFYYVSYGYGKNEEFVRVSKAYAMKFICKYAEPEIIEQEGGVKA